MTREQARREIDSLDFYLQNHTDDYGEESHTAMMMAIEALSRLENPNKCIPVSERYPEEEGEDYLVCYDEGTIRIRRLYFDLLDKPYFEYGQGIVAWMPLPTPYKVESEEV